MTIYPSVEYTAIFYWRDESTSSRDCFDDNVTEGIENFTAVFSEYTLSLCVRLNQNSSTAIIYIEDNGESAGSHHWYAALLLLGIQVVHVLRCTYVCVQLY